VVGLDWLDREEAGGVAGAGRSRVVMLVSQRTAAPTGRAAQLHGYDTATFELAAPSALDPVPELTLPLVTGGLWQLPVRGGVLAPLDGVCLDAVSVSRTGRYVALLDRRVACDPTAPAGDNVLLLVDTVEGALVWSTTAAPVRGVPPLIAQGTGRLEYLTGAVLRTVALADLSPVGESAPLPSTFDPIRALGRHGPDRLVVMNDELYRIDAAGAVTGPAATQPNVLGFVETGTGLPILLRTSSRLVVHAGPGDAEPQSLARAYQDGDSDVTDQLTYLVRPGAIDTFDLLLYDRTVTNPIAAVITSYPAPELAQPRAITWFRPRPTVP
jgi:hypothetical protein